MGTVGLLARDFYPIHAFHRAAPGSSSSLSQRGCPSFWHLGLLVFSPLNTLGGTDILMVLSLRCLLPLS